MPISKLKIKLDFLSLILGGGKDKYIRVHDKGHKKSLVQFIPIPWIYVIVFALLNGLSINVVRLFWFRYVGRPDVKATHISVERDLAIIQNTAEK